jgi:hypothetical protein
MNELSNLDLETVSAGMDKSGPDPLPGAAPTPKPAPTGGPVPFRNRIIAVKKVFGVPPEWQEVGIPQLLPK